MVKVNAKGKNTKLLAVPPPVSRLSNAMPATVKICRWHALAALFETGGSGL